MPGAQGIPAGERLFRDRMLDNGDKRGARDGDTWVWLRERLPTWEMTHTQREEVTRKQSRKGW